MSQLIYRSFTTWKYKTSTARSRAQFRVDFSATRDLLKFELEKLKAGNAVIEVGAKEFIAGGMPRQKTIWHPGVVVSFDCTQGQLVYPAERFTDWRDNLRAIALSLEALRKVDRYGVTQGGEQYQGWKPLREPPETDDDAFESAQDAIHWLAGESSIFLSALHPDEQSMRRAYQIVVHRVHPDAGGDAAKFRKLQKAKALLGI